MDRATAYAILKESIINLQHRRGQITLSDVEAEVINNACLAILRRRREITNNASNIEDIFKGVISSVQEVVPYTQAFTEAAALLFSDYRDKEAVTAIMGIQQNVAWEGMWDYLRDYFQKNHGLSIDTIETTSTIFYSTSHKRYENGVLVADSKADRTINISFIEDREIIVSIEPSLSPKNGYLIDQTGNQKKFKGHDPDYLFIVNMDSFDEVESFILEMPNRNLRIHYFE